MQCIIRIRLAVSGVRRLKIILITAPNAVQKLRILLTSAIYAEQSFFMEVKPEMKKQNEIRKKSLLYFGFGIDAMKNPVVCPNCNSLEPSNKIFCSKCNSKLPKANLYDLYKSYHICCEKCGTVLSSSMHYCPHCGIRVKVTSKLCAL